jgi:microcystin-dependent protein
MRRGYITGIWLLCIGLSYTQAELNVCSSFSVDESKSTRPPVGSVLMFSASTGQIPDGFLYANGGCYNSVANPEYADLYDVIGTRYGGSSPSSFCLPYLLNRFIYGSSESVLGNTGGATSVGLSITHMGQHRHNVALHRHRIGTSGADNNDHSCNFQGCADSDAGENGSMNMGSTCGLQAQGGNGAHNNLPHYRAFYHIITY